MRRKMKDFLGKIILIIFLFFAWITIVQAADVDLERIVVTPSRTEKSYKSAIQKVDVITAGEIESSQAESPAKVLEEISSVAIKDYGGPAAAKYISMRGANSKQVLIMIDGRPVNSAHSGDVDLGTIPVDNISRIEVVHGPVSGLYGSSAMGGVVNIITKEPPKKGFQTSIYSGFGTFRSYTEKLNHGGCFGKFGYFVSGDYKSSQGSRGHSEYSAKNSNIKMEYSFTDMGKISFNSGFSRSDSELPGSKTNSTLDDYQKWLKRFFDVTWKVKLQDRLGVSLKTYENHDRLEYTNRPVPLDRSVHLTKKRGEDLQFDYQLFDFDKLLFGFNYVGNFDDSSKTKKHKYNVRSGYFQNQMELFKKLKIDFGARVDDYSNFGTETTPNISLAYEINDNIKIHSLYGSSFRAPTFSDLYWDEASAKGNPNLMPEKGKSYELGIEQRFFNNLTADLTYFRNDFKDMINWQQGADSIWQVQNVNKANIQGVEFNSNLALNQNLDLNLEYTYQRPRDQKLHKYLTDQPQYKVNASLGYHDLKGFKINMKWQFVNRTFSNETNTQYVKRYFLLGLDASKKLNQFATIFISMDNVINRAYEIVKNYPMPGFSVNGGLKAEF
ncbi:MAG: TonB-dependent receptor [Candidatus Omnitrophota bacterium]